MAFLTPGSTSHVLPLAPGARSGRQVTRLQYLARQLRRSRQATIGLAIVGTMTLIALLAPVLVRWDVGVPVLTDALLSPSRAHPMVTDELGRDVLGRLIHGARVSLSVAALAVGVSVLAGVPLGMVAGFWEGKIGSAVMRFTEAIQAFPAVLLAIAIASALGPGIENAMIAIGVVGIPAYARLARAEVLRLKSSEFVHAARASGAGSGRILIRHVMPNGTAPIIVAISTGSASAILTEAALSFVGLGATPPTPSWGSMLQNGYQFITIAPWLGIFPGIAISITTFGFIFLGDGLRDLSDPRLRGR
ncbi:MAG: ABC transporter permease [Thermomicrobiales bacterium]|nr:ABC transporter permease [Thermomicrobiales bacterium]